MLGKMAYSKAGHDKDSIYIIVKTEGSIVFLADGKYKTMSNLKKKNAKHIQIIKKDYDKELQQRIAGGQDVRDEEIKRAIKIYKASI